MYKTIPNTQSVFVDLFSILNLEKFVLRVRKFVTRL